MMFFMSALVALTTLFSCAKEDALDTLTSTEISAIDQLSENADADLVITYLETVDYFVTNPIGDDDSRGGGKKGDGFDKKGKKKKQIALDSLTQTIKTYIATNYVGATLNKAFADASGNIVVFVTKADGTDVALLFDVAGLFVKEISGKTHGNHGNHGGVKDSSKIVAISDLPAAITTYLSTNYAGATILNAHTEANGYYDVTVKKADGTTVKLYFDAKGVFVKIGVKGGVIVDISTLATAITDYISTNYAGATITKAALRPDGSYEVSITTTAGKKVKLLFDKDGKFVKVK